MNSASPLLAFGNNISNIGFAKVNIPIVHGTPIKIVINKEKEILFLMLCMSPLAFPAEIAGTKAVAKAILKDKGSITNVSIFPLKIPY